MIDAPGTVRSRRLRWFPLAVVFASLLPATRPAFAVCPPLFDGYISSFGTAPGQIRYPNGLATDAAGRIYVTDPAGEFVHVFEADGTFVTRWGGFGGGLGQFNELVNLTVHGNYVYAVELDGCRVQFFTLSGGIVGAIGGSGSTDGRFLAPRGVGIGPTGTIYVADTGNDRIQYFTSQGAYLGQWAIEDPFDVDTDDAGDVYVVSHVGNIHRFDSVGNPVAVWSGSIYGGLHQPFGLDVANGYVYVAEPVNGRFLQFTTAGSVVATWQGVGRDVARGVGDDLFVIDNYVTRIRRFTAREIDCGPPAPLPNGAPGIAIGVHVTEAGSPGPCLSGVTFDCTQSVTRGGLASPDIGPWYYVYVLAKVDTMLEVGGLQCGVMYQGGSPSGLQDQVGLDVYSWTSCADFQFADPAWPAPGTGNLIAWDPDSRCQRTQSAIAGFFYVGAYTPDALSITAHPATGVATLVDCHFQHRPVHPQRLGWAPFSPGVDESGCNPCRSIRCAPPTSGVPGVQALSSGPPVPNPFRSSVSFRYTLPAPATVEAAIFDIQGRRIRALPAVRQPVGEHEFRWDGRDDAGHDAASGAYFARVVAGSRVLEKRLLRIP